MLLFRFPAMQKIIAQLAQEIQVRPQQIEAAVQLLDEGSTVPFIARYRKEVTGGLDDIQLRELETRLSYLRELRDRKEAVCKLIDEQGKLTPVLMAAIHSATTKQELEDIYLPFKLKRRTKGQLAKEAGLEPLADALFADPTLVPAEAALSYVIPMRPVVEGEDKQPDFSTVPAVLDGVRDLLSERWAENPALVQALREWLGAEGLLPTVTVSLAMGAQRMAGRQALVGDAPSVIEGGGQQRGRRELRHEHSVVPGSTAGPDPDEAGHNAGDQRDTEEDEHRFGDIPELNSDLLAGAQAQHEDQRNRRHGVAQ